MKGLEAGLDLEMPSSNGYNDAKIVAAVQNGSLDEAVLDRAVERILKVVFSYVDARRPDTVFDRAKDHAEAVAVETQCAVLLTNQGVLPLGTDQKIAYIGEFAAAPRYQGGGSSHIHPSRVTSAWEVAQQRRNVCYAKGFSAMRDEMTDAELAEAIQAAQNADVAVVFAGLPESFESEGYDRTSMELPACQNRLIDEIAKVQPHVVVVLHNGSAVELPWADRVSAILELYLGGEGVGEAADQLLYGEVTPADIWLRPSRSVCRTTPAICTFRAMTSVLPMARMSLSATATTIPSRSLSALRSVTACPTPSSLTAICSFPRPHCRMARPSPSVWM